MGNGLLIFIICFVFSGVPSLGQSLPSPAVGRVYWLEGRKIRILPDKIEINGPLPAQHYSMNPPAHSVWMTFGQGSVWALTKETTSFEKKIDSEINPIVIQYLWRSTDFCSWEKYGVLAPPLVEAGAFLPLEEGLILFFTRAGFQFSSGHWAPMYIAASNDQGTLVLKKLVQLDIGEPLHLRPGARAPEGPELNAYTSNKNFLIYKNIQFEFPIPIYQLDSGYFIVSKHMGVFWYFDMKGNLKKRYQLFELMKDDDFSNIWKFERAIIGCNSAPDQRLLVASRTKEAVFLAQGFYPSIVDEDKNLVDRHLAKYREQQNRNTFPDIIWWELDPESASSKRIDPPPGAPIDIRNLPIGRDLSFSFRGDGQILFESLSNQPPESSPKKPSNPSTQPEDGKMIQPKPVDPLRSEPKKLPHPDNPNPPK